MARPLDTKRDNIGPVSPTKHYDDELLSDVGDVLHVRDWLT